MKDSLAQSPSCWQASLAPELSLPYLGTWALGEWCLCLGVTSAHLDSVRGLGCSLGLRPTGQWTIWLSPCESLGSAVTSADPAWASSPLMTALSQLGRSLPPSLTPRAPLVSSPVQPPPPGTLSLASCACGSPHGDPWKGPTLSCRSSLLKGLELWVLPALRPPPWVLLLLPAPPSPPCPPHQRPPGP